MDASNVRALDEYADDELVSLYDLEHADYDADLDVYSEFARRGELPSLELGVGSGRVALHLARMGLHVTGIDTSPRMLARLEAQLDPVTAPLLRLREADMRDFDLRGEKFDLVYCALSTFEHLLTPADQLAALRCVAKHLAKGGVFVAQLRPLLGDDWSTEPAPLRLAWTRTDARTGETVTKLSSSVASPSRQLITYTSFYDRIAADGSVRRRVAEVTLRRTGRFEMESLMREAGLRLANLYGDTGLSPYEDDSDTMLVVAELSSA
jgi:SAM-dependent methyltransferase